MHSYKSSVLLDSARPWRQHSLSQLQGSCHKLERHVTWRHRGQVTKAYVTDRSAGVSQQHRSGIAHRLQDILESSINIVQLKRQAPVGVDLSPLVTGVPSFDAQATCTNHPDSVQEAVQQLLSYLPCGPTVTALSTDMQSVIQEFLNISGSETVHASLSIITCTPCPRFHADHVELRCLCTYVGEGTYFVPNKAVNRHKWMHALGIHDTNGFAVKTATSIQQASEWDVLVLKGEAFAGNQGAGAVHRSPAASEDRPRLVLTLNKARQQCCDGCVSQ